MRESRKLLPPNVTTPFAFDQIKELYERHQKDLADSRQKLLLSEQAKREKWSQQKAKAIKVSQLTKKAYCIN